MDRARRRVSCRPRAAAREIWLLVIYGAVSSFVYGLLVNMSFWPFALGDGTRLSYVAGAPVLENLHRYLLFDATTSLGWDTGRAITNACSSRSPAALCSPRCGAAARRASFTQPGESSHATAD